MLASPDVLVMLQEPGQKIIDLDSAIQMWGIVMEGNPHLPPFLKYLAEQKDYKTINMDQWSGWLRFTQEVQVQSTSACKTH